MSYILNLATGVVTRVSDGIQVAPAQSAEDPLYLDYTNWVTSGNQPTLVNTPPPASVDAGRKITKLAFRNRFTSSEKVALEMLSLDDPSAPPRYPTDGGSTAGLSQGLGQRQVYRPWQG